MNSTFIPWAECTLTEFYHVYIHFQIIVQSIGEKWILDSDFYLMIRLKHTVHDYSTYKKDFKAFHRG